MLGSNQLRKEIQDLTEKLEKQSSKLSKLEKDNEVLLKEGQILSEKFLKNKAILEEKQGDFKIYEGYMHQFIDKVSLGWPRLLSNMAELNQDEQGRATSQIGIIHLKSLVEDFEFLFSFDSHDRNEEIILVHLIGKATYKYLDQVEFGSDKSETILENITHYLNANCEYAVTEHHGFNKHYDGRYHISDEEIEEMEKVRLLSFIVRDKSNNSIIKKAVCTK